MFNYFSNFNLSSQNGDSATISIKNWIVLQLISLLSVIPIVGSVVVLVLYIILAFRNDVAPSLANYLKAMLIISAVVLAITVVICVIVCLVIISISI